jgi:hypothetical protein
MTLLIARRSPAAGTPGVRMSDPSCSCGSRRSYTGTRRRQLRTFPFLHLTPPLQCVLGRMRTKAKLLLACRSTTATGTQGRMKLRTDSLIVRPPFRAPTTTTTGAPSTTTSTLLLPPREQLCNRSCSNKHTHTHQCPRSDCESVPLYYNCTGNLADRITGSSYSIQLFDPHGFRAMIAQW